MSRLCRGWLTLIGSCVDCDQGRPVRVDRSESTESTLEPIKMIHSGHIWSDTWANQGQPPSTEWHLSRSGSIIVNIFDMSTNKDQLTTRHISNSGSITVDRVDTWANQGRTLSSKSTHEPIGVKEVYRVDTRALVVTVIDPGWCYWGKSTLIGSFIDLVDCAWPSFFHVSTPTPLIDPGWLIFWLCRIDWPELPHVSNPVDWNWPLLIDASTIAIVIDTDRINCRLCRLWLSLIGLWAN